MRLPKALSPGEESFAMHCLCYRLAPVREHVFAPGHRYRFDFAFLEEKIAVEIEGGIWIGGRHSRGGKAFETDLRKYNLATELGWRVFRFSTAMVESGEAIDTVLVALGKGILIAERVA